MDVETLFDLARTTAAVAIIVAGTTLVIAGTVYVVTRAVGFAIENTAAYTRVVAWLLATRGGKIPWVVAPEGGAEDEVLRLRAELDQLRTRAALTSDWVDSKTWGGPG